MNELRIVLIYRPGAGWGCEVHIGDRLLASHEPGSFRDSASAYRQAAEDFRAAQAAARERMEGGA